MNRTVPGVLTFFVVAWMQLAEAQPKKVRRIGLLVASAASPTSARINAFRHGLRELGYVEGKNIQIEYRYGEGKPDLLPALAAQLAALKVDIIVTGGSSPTHAAGQKDIKLCGCIASWVSKHAQQLR